MRQYGFNFQWMYRWSPGHQPQPPDLAALDFMAQLGLTFVRLPTDYQFWANPDDYFRPDERGLEHVDGYLEACRQRNLHLSLNLHRAPGYCINEDVKEKHNLWRDQQAQDAFVFQWEMFARRYQSVPATALSFDLLNEPPRIGFEGGTVARYASVMRRTVEAIRAIDPQRPVVVDGMNIGMDPVRGLADLDIIQSTRGFQPILVSHHRAEWVERNLRDRKRVFKMGLASRAARKIGRLLGSGVQPGPVWPAARYPGTVWRNKIWDRDTVRECFEPWRELESRGVSVQVGEFGCYNRTPNDVAMRWMTDLLSVYKEYRWGYAMWEFNGPFGVVEHGRPGATYEKMNGFSVDRQLLDLLLENRVLD